MFWKLFSLGARRANRGEASGPFLRRLRIEPLEHRQLLSLGTLALLEGPAAGSDSDIVTATGAWTATANASWLHTSSCGTVNGLATFTFDANAGATRTGTLTIAGATLTVTQAGSGYVAAGMETLVPAALEDPGGLVVDGAGDVYVADEGAIKEWNPSTQTLSTLNLPGLSWGLASSNSGKVYFVDGNGANCTIEEWNFSTQTLNSIVTMPSDGDVAVDAEGNVYMADMSDSTVMEWNAATKTLSTIISSGLVSPWLLAVDDSGDVYVTGFNDTNVKEWTPAGGAVINLASTGMDAALGLAVNAAGNVYIAETSYPKIVEWNAQTRTAGTLVDLSADPGPVAVDTSGNVYFTTAMKVLQKLDAKSGVVSTLASSVLSRPDGIAVDRSGNVFIADEMADAVDEWNAATQEVSTLIPSATLISLAFAYPQYMAADNAGNIYIDSCYDGILEWQAATQAVTWPNTAYQGACGVAVDDAGDIYFPDAGNVDEWNAAKQTVSAVVSSGLSSPYGLAVDCSGNIFINDLGESNTIQEWNAATHTLGTLVSSGLNQSYDIAVDCSGNVYVADPADGRIEEWNAFNSNAEHTGALGGLAVWRRG